MSTNLRNGAFMQDEQEKETTRETEYHSYRERDRQEKIRIGLITEEVSTLRKIYNFRKIEKLINLYMGRHENTTYDSDLIHNYYEFEKLITDKEKIAWLRKYRNTNFERGIYAGQCFEIEIGSFVRERAQR